MRSIWLSSVALLLSLTACNSGDGSDASDAGSSDTGDTTDGGTTGEPDELDVYEFAKTCVSVRSGDTYLAANGAGDAFAFSASNGEGAARFFMQPSDLGTYLFYDENGGYFVSEDGSFERQTSLMSDVLLVDDEFISGAEWILETSEVDPQQYAMRSRRLDTLLTTTGLTSDPTASAPVTFEPAQGCKEHPELTVDATGEITKTTFDNGDLYGIVDTHSHILSNFAFGGGGIYHGGAFHRLGVEHALPDCAPFHGENGRLDFFGYVFDTSGSDAVDLSSVIPDLIAGELSEDNHITDGYPEFTEWPNAVTRSTHQVQYYKWLERAHMAGLRLVIQHATTNSVICKMTAGQGYQPTRYDCEDMTAVDRIIDETYNMERYIDAQAGGPGLGFFRVVQTPAQAREVIAAGKMAVVLGIETSDIFNCFITPRNNAPECTEAYVKAQLDAYYARGVRALFPVHKYDNKFTPGDGDRAFIELGNFFNSGHYTNMTLDCPTDDTMPHGFDNGDVAFGGLLMPRDVYDSPAPLDMSNFAKAPLATAIQYLSQINEPAVPGDFCQNAVLTPLGETLILEMMKRGMIIEVDHLPQWSYQRVYEMLEENDYPASGSHGRNWAGKLYELGGVATTGFGRCQDAANPGSTVQGFKDRIALIASKGAYPAEGFGFDLNGFAGARGPRFGEGVCPTEQQNPVTYPFDSFAGDVTFTQPQVGNRTIDFNTEGMVHIGMLPELLQDARSDALSDADIEPIFHSAEGYIRMWEKAEARASAIRGQ